MPRIRNILLLHHSHTDVGFTHQQPVFWEMQRRFLDSALGAAERDAEVNAAHAFRWNVETTAPLLHWLERTPAPRVRRFAELCALGRIEVTAHYLHLTPSADPGEYADSYAPLARFRDMGIPVSHAMSGDVNGHNWTLVDSLLDHGVTSLSMAINEHCGGAPFVRPNVFRWASPTGRTVLAYNGPQYHLSHWLGVLESAEMIEKNLPLLQRVVDAAGWPSETLPLQVSAYLRDNGTAGYWLSEWVRAFNAQSAFLRLRLATWQEFWSENDWTRQTPVHAGDWTDYWNFGAGSTSGLVRRTREARSLLRTASMAQGLLAACPNVAPDLQGVPPPADTLPGRHPPETLRTAETHYRQAVGEVLVANEHTWGGSESVGSPFYHEAVAFDHFKDHSAISAAAVSRMLARDSVAELARHHRLPESSPAVAFNPLPWARTVWAQVPTRVTSLLDWGHLDPSAVRHFQDRARDSECRRYPAFVAAPLALTPLPASPEPPPTVTNAATVVVGGTRLVFDLERGGLAEWHDPVTGKQLVDRSSPYTLGLPVYEEVDRERLAPGQHPRNAYNGPIQWTIEGHRRNWHPDWPVRRATPTRVLGHRVETYTAGVVVSQRLDFPSLGAVVELTFTCAAHDPAIRVDARWVDPRNPHPRATYLAFPLALQQARPVVDLGGVLIRPDIDQLPGTCRDYFTAQNFAALVSEGAVVTLACAPNPLLQIGGFHFGQDQQTRPETANLLLGWVSNNYWETNFRAFQPEAVHATYVLSPSRVFSEEQAQRLALDLAFPPLFQTTREPGHPGAGLEVSRPLLVLPPPPVLCFAAPPQGDLGELHLRLFAASDVETPAMIASGQLSVRSARCDRVSVVQVDGGVSLTLPPRRMTDLWLTLRQG